VADAINLQDDMNLVGFAISLAIGALQKRDVRKEYDIYAQPAEAEIEIRLQVFPVKGNLEDLLKKTDLVWIAPQRI